MNATALFQSVAPTSRMLVPRTDDEEVRFAAERLRKFLEGDEGKASMAMLARSKSEILVLMTTAPREHQYVRYVLDGGGVRRDRMARLRDHDRDDPTLHSERLTSEMLEEMFASYMKDWRRVASEGREPIKPSRIVPHVRRELIEFAKGEQATDVRKLSS
jgi:hypothetical protein